MRGLLEKVRRVEIKSYERMGVTLGVKIKSYENKECDNRDNLGARSYRSRN